MAGESMKRMITMANQYSSRTARPGEWPSLNSTMFESALVHGHVPVPSSQHDINHRPVSCVHCVTNKSNVNRSLLAAC